LYLLDITQVSCPADSLLVLDEVTQADIGHLQPVQINLLSVAVGLWEADAVNGVENINTQGRVADLGDLEKR
jgi:hypothetical protein